MSEAQKRKQIYLICFGISACIIFILAICNHIYPFGEKCFLRTDLYNQYVPFYAELQRKLRAGESFSYSYYLGLGSNFMGVYAYYLANPFALLCAFIPKGFLIEFMTVLIFLQICLVCVSMAYYLLHHFGTSYAVIPFSLFYGFSAFMVAYNWNIMWLASVALAPLVMLGLEELFFRGKWKLYTISLFLAIWFNYYISIFICIFAVLYGVTLIIDSRVTKKFFKAFKFAACSMIAGLCAGFVVWPGANALMGTGFSKPNFPKTVKVYFNFLDMLSRHMFNVSVELKNDHWPNIYTGVMIFLLIPLFFLSSKIRLKDKICKGLLAVFFLLSFDINVLNFIWHGLNYPDSLPARQSFLYSFLLITMCYEAFLHLQEEKKWKLFVSYGIGVAFLGSFGLFVQHTEVFQKSVLLSFLYISVYLVFAFCYQTDGPNRKSILLLCIAFAAFEAGLNLYNTGFSTVTRAKYVTKVQALEGIEQALRGQDSRFDTNVRMTKNDGPLASLHTATIFSSTTNYGMYQFYQKMGMDYSKVYYCYEGATPLTSALLGVDYFIGSSDENFQDAFHTNRRPVMNHVVYNMNGLPFAYGLPESVTEDFYTRESAVDRLNAFGEELGADSPLYWECKVLVDGEKRQIRTIGEGTYYIRLENASKSNGDTILVEIHDKTTGNVIRSKKYKNARKGFFLSLGKILQSEYAVISTETGSLEKVTIKAYYQDDEMVKKALNALSAYPADEIVYGNHGFTCSTDYDQARKLVFTIPAEKGWQLSIDGTPVEATQFSDAFLAVVVPAGAHQIKGIFTSPGLKAGLIMSHVGVLLYLSLYLLEKKSKKGAK